jgi:acyl-CoA synthetase (AMP-forming)/AMP-acid ligase II
MSETLRGLLDTGADDAPAIPAPSRSPLSFGQLRRLIGDTIAQLNTLGIGCNDRVAMVLHTSGTTSRPKIVPLSQADQAASAANIRNTLKFRADDCGLNIMPLLHVHGLIAGVPAPLAAGSQVFGAPGFNALKFFAWHC